MSLDRLDQLRVREQGQWIYRVFQLSPRDLDAVRASVAEALGLT